MQVKTQSGKEEAIWCCCQPNLKCTVSKWEIVLWPDKLKFQIHFEKYGHCRPNMRGTIWLFMSTKFKSLDLWWCGNGLLPMGLAACTCEKAPSVLKGTRFFNPERTGIFQQDYAKLHTASNLLLQHGLVVEESGCWSGLPAVPTFYNIWRLIEQNIQQDPGLLSSYKPISDKNWTTFLSQVQQLASSIPRCLYKKRKCCTVVNMSYLSRCVAAIRFKMILYFSENCTFFQFKYEIWFICSIVIKVWVYEIWKSLHSAFIHTLHSIPTFLESVWYFCGLHKVSCLCISKTRQ